MIVSAKPSLLELLKQWLNTIAYETIIFDLGLLQCRELIVCCEIHGFPLNFTLSFKLVRCRIKNWYSQIASWRQRKKRELRQKMWWIPMLTVINKWAIFTNFPMQWYLNTSKSNNRHFNSFNYIDFSISIKYLMFEDHSIFSIPRTSQIGRNRTDLSPVFFSFR